MVDPIGGRYCRNPTVRSYCSRIPRSRGARGSIRWTRWTSFPGHARSANAASAGRRGTRQARTLPARRTPAGRLRTINGYGSLAPMRAIWAFVATALVLGSCVRQQDWIDRTLVTVDVTGSWYGTPGGPTSTGPGNPGSIFLDVRQEGGTVQRFLQIEGGNPSQLGRVGGPISGTVAGDVFRFKSTRDVVAGEFTVNGDEMVGTVSIGGTRPITLRRVDPSSRR